MARGGSGTNIADMKQDPSMAGERRKLKEQEVSWKFLSAMIWAPAFPIIRHSTSKLTGARRLQVIFSAIAVANLHAFWLINNPDLSDEALGITREPAR